MPVRSDPAPLTRTVRGYGSVLYRLPDLSCVTRTRGPYGGAYFEPGVRESHAYRRRLRPAPAARLNRRVAKRLLDTTARDIAGYTRAEKLAAIRGAEGRTIAAEVIAPAMALVYDVSNPELAASQGADLIILNVFDVSAPAVAAIPSESPDEVIRTVRRLTGRLVAVNLEPVDPEAVLTASGQFTEAGTGGRLATPENAQRAAALGVDAIVLTGNPGMGVTNAALERAISATRTAVGDEVILFAGKMHAAGTTEAGAGIIDDETIGRFVEAGADVILLPAPGTVPGCHEAQVRGWVTAAHRAGAMTMTAIGTSQEGADVDTIRALALMAKMTGTDIHHLGDCGYYGVTLPENLVAYSMAIRGRRHTYRRMAMSLLR